MLKNFCLIICFAGFACKDVAKQTPDSKVPPVEKKGSVLTKSDKIDKKIFNISPLNIQTDTVDINLAKGINFKLAVPAGYKISIAAEGLKRLRFMAVSPDGKLFCTDMYDRSDNKKGSVYIFDKWNDSIKKFGLVSTYLDSLHNPNQVAFHNNFIYVAETEKLVRYKYLAGDLQPKHKGQIIASFPDYGLSYKYGGWHLTRSIAFHNNKLYVSVGSSCNACLEKEEIRATITEMNPDGTDKKIYARGLRNSVGIKWIGDELWATTMGRDLIGPDKPEEQFLKVEKDRFYGWPYYFQYQNKMYEDAQFKDSIKPVYVKKPLVGFAGFKAHSAPLGFEYLKDFDDAYLKNSVLVCLHGSTTVGRQRGNAIVRVEGGNKYGEIVSGFLAGKTEKERYGRPCDILQKDKTSFYFTDDLDGVLYYFYK